MSDFYIVDTTLRDGEQAAGVAFKNEDKLKIAKSLDDAGVDIIEAGIPASGEEEMKSIYGILALNLKAEVLAWNRIKKSDIDKSILCGVKNIHISAPVSDIHIYRKLNKDREWIIQELKSSVAYAVDKGCIVSVGAEDASRADFEFLIEFFNAAKTAGATRVRYADTVSTLDPISAYNDILKLKNYIDIDIDFHGHNDFGMATANSLSAHRAGAKYISCSVNGLGERAGNAALEEIIMAFKYILNLKSNFDIKKLIYLSKIVEKASGRQVMESKPIVGELVFSHESGIHVDGMFKDTSTYEMFSPEDIGRKRNFIIGKSSGKKAVIHKFNELGINLNQQEAEEMLKIIKKKLA
jgi:homocitrate synthase NifV